MHSLKIQVGSIEHNLVIDHSKINQQSAWSNMMVEYIPLAEISDVSFEVARKHRTQVAFSPLLPSSCPVLSSLPQIVRMSISVSLLASLPSMYVKH